MRARPERRAADLGTSGGREEGGFLGLLDGNRSPEDKRCIIIGLMSFRALLVLIATSLALAGCGTSQSSASPATQIGQSSASPVSQVGQASASPSSQGEIRYQCSIKYAPGDVTQTQSQTYGVINLTVINGTSEPFAPFDYQVYVFKSPGIQDGTANVPESWKGEVAPGAQETFVGGDLWPLTDTCSLAAPG